MAYGNFGSESKPQIGSDFTINQYENASANYKLIAASVADVLQFLNAPNGAEFNITVPTAAGGKMAGLVLFHLTLRMHKQSQGKLSQQ
jgi:hypothetical protein